MSFDKKAHSNINPPEFIKKYKEDTKRTFRELTDLYKNEPNVLRSLLSRIASDIGQRIECEENKIITLSSKSSRRRALLNMLLPKKEIRILENNDDGELYIPEYTPKENALNITLQKFFSYLSKLSNNNCQDNVVITADTIVELPDGTPMGKMGGEHDPFKDITPIEKLKYIVNAGKDSPIKVHTAYVLFDAGKKELSFDTDTASLRFHTLKDLINNSDRMILKELTGKGTYSSNLNNLLTETVFYQDILIQYVENGLYEGKAGGFDIRDRDFFICVKEIIGDPTTIIGLPCEKLHNKFSGSTNLEAIIKNIWPTEYEQHKIK